jgi:hypothetical protein
VGEAPPEMHIPEGLRDVIGKRLSQLSPECNRVLAIAAVIGRDFELETLRRVADIPEEPLIDALEEARRVAVLQEQARVGIVRYRFAHAFFRQTLYEEMSAPRRLRLHQQVARALESQYATRLEDHAAELAEHFAQSTDADDLRKAVHYGELAARRAIAVYAYGEAVRLLKQAAEVQGVLDPDDLAKRCDLLLAQGEVMLPSEEPAQAATQVAPEAFALAEQLADSRRAARVSVLALEALNRARGQTAANWETPEAQEWLARADRYAVAGTADRVYADVYLGLSELGHMRPFAAHAFLRRAMDQAREVDDAGAYFLAAAYSLFHLNALRDREALGQLAAEFLDHPREGARSGHVGWGLLSGGTVLLERGARAGAEQAWRELHELAERTRDTTLAVFAIQPEAYLAMVDGKLEDAVAAFTASEVRAEALGVSSAAGGSRRYLIRCLLYLGQGEEALTRSEGPGRPTQGARAACLAHLDRHEEARAIRERFGDISSDEDETNLGILVTLLDAAVLGGDRETAQALARRLAPFAPYPCAKEVGVTYARLLGGAAALVGERERARAYYEQALEVCGRIGFRPETALTHLELAELLLGDALTPALSQEEREKTQQEAQAHLDFAVEEFRAMKMQAALERALRHKGLLHA